MSQQVHSLQLERLSLLWASIWFCGLILGLRLVQIQIIRGEEYTLAAERNRSQMIYQTAPRGRIYDRNGIALATNQPAFSLIYIPGKSKDVSRLERLAQDLSRELRRDAGELLEKLQQASRDESVVRLAENLPADRMFRLSELKSIYPGVDLIVEARRQYPFGRFASHLLGYMGRMDTRNWRELKSKGYRADSRIGRLGLENMFERELRGRDGGIRMEVDAQGHLKRVLEKIPWEAGSNLHLTLDAAIQKAADEGLRASSTGRGAVVALDPRNGDIRAIASAPDFDPNIFLSTNPDEVKTGATVPEFNNAISGTYAPGSTFKIVVGAAGLNEKKFNTADSVHCSGHFELVSRIFLCWEAKGHGRMSWFNGFTHSCDVYFYRMGLKTGGAAIEKYAKLFGLGAKTNIALKGEKRGNLFGPVARAGLKRSWYDGDTVNLAIGQGELLVTPIQMAVLTAAVANQGTLWRPHYTSHIAYAGGRPEYRQQPESVGKISLRKETWMELQEGLRLVVSSGTGRMAAIPGLEIFGKTGTAQNPGEDHAWFVSYARRPGEEPSLAVAVLVENGGHGGSAAAPIAKQIYLAAFKPRPAAVNAGLDAGGGGR